MRMRSPKHSAPFSINTTSRTHPASEAIFLRSTLQNARTTTSFRWKCALRHISPFRRSRFCRIKLSVLSDSGEIPYLQIVAGDVEHTLLPYMSRPPRRSSAMLRLLDLNFNKYDGRSETEPPAQPRAGSGAAKTYRVSLAMSTSLPKPSNNAVQRYLKPLYGRGHNPNGSIRPSHVIPHISPNLMRLLCSVICCVAVMHSAQCNGAYGVPM